LTGRLFLTLIAISIVCVKPRIGPPQCQRALKLLGEYLKPSSFLSDSDIALRQLTLSNIDRVLSAQ